MAAVSVEDIRRAYYEGPAASNMNLWITELQVTPPQLIVADESTAQMFRVAYAISPAGEVTFADPQEVEVEYVDKPAVAAVARRARARDSAVRAAAAGSGSGDGPVRRMLRNQQLIEAALKRGAVTQESALAYARQAGRGQDIGIVASLTGAPWLAAENKQVMAQSNSALMNKIIDLLGQAIGGAPEPDDDEFAALFLPRSTLIYDQNDDGSRPAPRAVPAATTPPGYQVGNTTNVHTPYASGRYQAYAAGRYDGHPGTMRELGELDDEQADSLFPQTGMTEAQSHQAAAIDDQERRERDAAVRAGALAPYDEAEIERLLFGGDGS